MIRRTFNENPPGSLNPCALVRGGHRGFRGKYPENSLLSFDMALIEGHVDFIEVDLRLSADNILVLSHDTNTARCFGENYEISSNNYLGVLDRLVYKDSLQRMATFSDLLSLVTSDDQAHSMKLMLDIKPNNPNRIIAMIIKELRKFNLDLIYWSTYIVFGVWSSEFVELCEMDAPEFPIALIGTRRDWQSYEAQQIIDNKHVKIISLQILTLKYLVSKDLDFLNNLKRKGKAVYAWTVNDKYNMKWCLDNNVDGLITDFPDYLYDYINKIYSANKLSLFFRFSYYFLFPILEAIFLPGMVRLTEWYIHRKYLKNSNIYVKHKTL